MIGCVSLGWFILVWFSFVKIDWKCCLDWVNFWCILFMSEVFCVVRKFLNDLLVDKSWIFVWLEREMRGNVVVEIFLKLLWIWFMLWSMMVIVIINIMMISVKLVYICWIMEFCIIFFFWKLFIVIRIY